MHNNPVTPASEKPQWKIQAVRFLATGIFSAVVDYGFVIFLLWCSVVPHLANGAGFIAGTTVAYLINRRWTFDAEPSRQRFFQVVVLYVVAFLLRTAIFAGIFAISQSVGATPFIATSLAWIVAQGCVTVMNFLVQRLVIFKK